LFNKRNILPGYEKSNFQSVIFSTSPEKNQAAGPAHEIIAETALKISSGSAIFWHR